MSNRVCGSIGAFLWLCSLPAAAAWTTNISEDEMTGEVEAYASSPATTATKSMGFPYTGTEAWMGVGCNTSSEWAYFGFSGAPNLRNTETRDGYNKISTRIKWDDSVSRVTLIQEWGERFIHFRNDSEAIKTITKRSEVLLELDWHGQGQKYFRFSLDGSAAAVAKIRNACGR